MVTSMFVVMGLVAKLSATPEMHMALIVPDRETVQTPTSGIHELDGNDWGASAMFRELNSGTGRRESGSEWANGRRAFSR